MSTGKILGLVLELRKRVGVVEAKTKQGVKFKVRSNEDLVDKVAQAANDLGILIYPRGGEGKGFVVDSGTLAEVSVKLVLQSVEDGSSIEVWGFGLGADNQDKAGGKAGTYAFKQALIQTLLAGGTKAPKSHKMPDTDDTDTPIEGGVRPRSKGPTIDDITTALAGAADEVSYRAAVDMLKRATPAIQVLAVPLAREARARCVK